MFRRSPEKIAQSKSMLEDAAKGLIDQSQVVSEHVRLKVLKQLNILDTPPEVVYNDVVNVARKVCNTEAATLTFIGEFDAFLKATTRPNWRSHIPRNDTFCNIAIRTPNQIMLVPDAKNDERVKENIYVKNGMVRFYCGCPLVTEQGVALGALCVVDAKPRELDDEQVAALQSLTRIVTQLVMRGHSITE